MEYKPQNEEMAKKEYSTPDLTIHGEVRVLTQSGSTGDAEAPGNSGVKKA